MPKPIKNTPFAIAFNDQLEKEKARLAEMKKVFETQQPFLNGVFISRKMYKEQKAKVLKMESEIKH